MLRSATFIVPAISYWFRTRSALQRIYIAIRQTGMIWWLSPSGLGLPKLSYIPLAPGQADAIEILADRHGVLAGRA